MSLFNREKPEAIIVNTTPTRRTRKKNTVELTGRQDLYYCGLHGYKPIDKPCICLPGGKQQ